MSRPVRRLVLVLAMLTALGLGAAPVTAAPGTVTPGTVTPGTAAPGTAAAATGSGPAPAQEGERRTTICYASFADPERERTIQVARSAVPGILRTSLSYRGPCAAYGPSLPMGEGKLRAFTVTRDERPLAIGVTFPASALRGLPTEVSDGNHCFDKNGDGEADLHTECAVGHEHVLGLPAGFTRQVDTPFGWALVNWNPEGHPPPEVYELPHFDVHFYIQPLWERNNIDPGPCPILVDCADHEQAIIPVPARYIHPDFADVGAIEAAMGNHLVDITAPEFQGEPFRYTWIYGAYGGEVTFYEAMITKAWFEQQRAGQSQNLCAPIKQPEAWWVAGWYPTRYCMEYRENRDDHVVSMEGFVYREAS